MIGCCGGGSNFAGLAFPFIQDKINGDDDRNNRCRALLLPYPDKRDLHVRPWRHCQNDPAFADVQFGPQLHSSTCPCRWFTLSRDVANGKCCPEEKDIFLLLPFTNPNVLKQVFFLPKQKESFRHQNPTTQLPRPYVKPIKLPPKEKRKPLFSTYPVTG